MLGLRALLSEKAPTGFQIDAVSLSGGVGSLRATIGDYSALEKMMDDLENATDYAFVLEHATSVGNKISVSLRVKML